MESSKNFIKIFFGVCFGVLVLVCGVNYKIDSLGLFQEDNLINSAAKNLANGKYMAGLLGKIDERIFRKKVIENIDYSIDWIALGSSRIMQLKHSFFLDKNETFQNYGVSGASLEDYMALVSIHLVNQKKLPKGIVIGVDPWIFNKFNGQNRYRSILNDYKRMINLISIKHENYDLSFNNKDLNKYFKLLSYEYLSENIKNMKNYSNGHLYYIVNENNINNTDDYIIEPDGSIQYPFKYRFPNEENTKKNAISYTKGKVYSLESFNKIDNTVLFENFINYLKSNNVEVVFYLPPYNPITYDILISNQKYKIINDVENYLSDFANKNSIKIIGSYNPNKYGFKNRDFFDGMHSLSIVYKKLFFDFKKSHIANLRKQIADYNLSTLK